MAVITFSREPHSGTQDLARQLAQRLSYRYVGLDELARAVSARGGVERVPQTSESEGRSPSMWEQLGEHLTGDRETYVSALKAVVTELAVADNVVIVGHGAGLVLGNLPGVLRVFVVGPKEDRAARLIAEGGAVGAEQARRAIEQRDRQSSGYLRYVFGIDWLDPHHWDLVINTSRANLPVALDMLAHYAQGRVRDRGEQDQLGRMQLAARIERTLLADDDLGVDKLRVRVERDAIVLQGDALAEEDRRRAAAIAHALAPEADLDNQIILRPPTSS